MFLHLYHFSGHLNQDENISPLSRKHNSMAARISASLPGFFFGLLRLDSRISPGASLCFSSERNTSENYHGSRPCLLKRLAQKEWVEPVSFSATYPKRVVNCFIYLTILPGERISTYKFIRRQNKRRQQRVKTG